MSVDETRERAIDSLIDRGYDRTQALALLDQAAAAALHIDELHNDIQRQIEAYEPGERVMLDLAWPDAIVLVHALRVASQAQQT